MHKVSYFDKTYVIVKDEQVEQIAAMKAKGKPFWLNHSTGRDFVDPKSIALITKAKYGEYSLPEPKMKQLADPGMSDEQRAKAREKLEEIKRTAPWYRKASSGRENRRRSEGV